MITITPWKPEEDEVDTCDSCSHKAFYKVSVGLIAESVFVCKRCIKNLREAINEVEPKN